MATAWTVFSWKYFMKYYKERRNNHGLFTGENVMEEVCGCSWLLCNRLCKLILLGACSVLGTVLGASHTFSYLNLNIILWVCVWKSFSHVQLFATPWTVARQAPLSIEFSRPEYWSGLPFSSPGDLPNPGIEPRSPTFQPNSLPSQPPGKPTVLRGRCRAPHFTDETSSAGRGGRHTCPRHMVGAEPTLNVGHQSPNPFFLKRIPLI